MDENKTDTTTVQPVEISTDKKIIPKKEFWMFSVAALGQGMIYATMSSFISDYYVNVMQVPLLFVLLLMLLARVWDAVNDPLMGIIVDRHTTRWGKMKPYVAFAALPIAALTFLMFFNPNFASSTATMIYCSVVYVMWGMTYTLADVPFWSLPNVMTNNPSERANTISFARTLNGVGSALPSVLFTVMSWFIANDQTKYSITSGTAAIIGIILFMLTFSSKERINIPNKPRKSKSEPSQLKRIFTCKPLMLVIIMGILSSGRYLMQGAALHVARYALYVGPTEIAGLTTVELATLASKSKGSIYLILQICSAAGMFGSMLFMPFFYKRFDYKKIVIFTCIAGFLSSIITAIIGAFCIYGDNQWMVYLLIPFLLIECIPLGALNITAYAMIGDCLDYLEWQTGYRDNALGSSCQSFVNKLGNALATTLVIAMYMIIQLDPAEMYSETAIKLALEIASHRRFAMFSLISIIPGVSLLLCALPIFKYDLVGEKKERITRELAEKRIAEGVTIE